MSSEIRRTTLDNHPIEYKVRVSEEATQPRIDVGIRDITVVVPDGDDTDPETLLRDHEDWVLEKKAKFDRYLEAAPDRVFEEGESFPYLGEQHELLVERRSSSDIEDGKICLAEHHVEQTSIKQALEKLYRRKTRDLIEDYLDEYADEIGVDYDKLEIRNQRTKWGSCSSSGTLGINWRLVMAPPNILEYVVVHELAHLKEGNHTDAFWSLVSKFDPDYMEHAKWLDEHGTKLIFTKADL